MQDRLYSLIFTPIIAYKPWDIQLETHAWLYMYVHHSENFSGIKFSQKAYHQFSQYNVHACRQSCPFYTIQNFRGLNFHGYNVIIMLI